jgi:hypothetical protein
VQWEDDEIRKTIEKDWEMRKLKEERIILLGTVHKLALLRLRLR